MGQLDGNSIGDFGAKTLAEAHTAEAVANVANNLRLDATGPKKNCEGNSKTSAKARLKAFWVVAGILEASATPEEACEQSVCPMLPLTSHMRSS